MPLKDFRLVKSGTTVLDSLVQYYGPMGSIQDLCSRSVGTVLICMCVGPAYPIWDMCVLPNDSWEIYFAGALPKLVFNLCIRFRHLGGLYASSDACADSCANARRYYTDSLHEILDTGKDWVN